MINLPLIRPNREISAEQRSHRVLNSHLPSNDLSLAQNTAILTHQRVTHPTSQIHGKVRNLNRIPTTNNLDMHNPTPSSLAHLNAQLGSKQSRPVSHFHLLEVFRNKSSSDYLVGYLALIKPIQPRWKDVALT